MPKAIVIGLGCIGCAALAFMLGGVFWVTLFIKSTISIREAHGWPTTPGAILSSKVESYQYQGSVGGKRGKRRQVTRTGHRARVEYEYTVGQRDASSGDLPAEESGNSKRYTSTQLRLSAGDNEPHKAVARYPAGKRVTVHYDPQDPSRAVLELESTESWTPLLAGIAFGSVGLLILFMVLRFVGLV